MPQLGSWGWEETGRLLSHQGPLRATRAIGKRVKMEGEGGGSGGGAGTSGDGGEQLLTVKHELRTGERPRPLPAGPAAEARLGARWGARAAQGGRGLGRPAEGGASWAEASPGVPGGSGQGAESLPAPGPQCRVLAWEDAFAPPFLHR